MADPSAGRRGWLRRNGRPLAYLALIAAALGGALYLLFDRFTPMGSGSWYLLGVLHVLLAVSFVGAVWLVLLTAEPDATRRRAWGEEYTRDELRRAHRRRLVRHALHDITLDDGDVDHLVITRHGGLLAVDSKWRSVVEPEDMSAMAASAAASAARAGQMLGGLSSWGGRGSVPPVRPVLVLWGKAQKELDLPQTVDGVDFVRGSDLVEWLRILEGDRFSRRESRVLVRELTYGPREVRVRRRPRAQIAPN